MKHKIAVFSNFYKASLLTVVFVPCFIQVALYIIYYNKFLS